MRFLLLSLVALTLVLPAVAPAQGTSGTSTSGATQAVKKKKVKAAAQKKATKKAASAKVAKKKTSSTKPKAASSITSSSGSAGETELTGPVTALGGGSITVGTMTCVIPPGANVAAVVVGDIVEIDCRLVGGVWTLAKLSREDAGDAQGEVEVKGPITALSATSVTVGTTTCAIPTGVTLTGFQIGTDVELECDLVGGVLTLSKLKVEDDEADENGDDDDDSGPSAADDDDSGSGGGSSGSGSEGSGGADD